MEQPLLDERRLKAVIQDWCEQSGKRLRARRQALGYRQDRLADLVGVRSTAISKFELGIATPKDSVRLAIACALLCEVSDIWPPVERHNVMLLARSEVAA